MDRKLTGNFWSLLVVASLVVFFASVIIWQLSFRSVPPDETASSVILSYVRGDEMASISDIVEREKRINPANAACRLFDLQLPQNARVFLVDMIGPTNYDKVGQYFWMTYYLFPREVGTSLDHRTRMTPDRFVGTTSESDEEIVSNGFNVRTDVAADGSGMIRTLVELPFKERANPPWFDSTFDWVVAFLLPGLTAFAGMWLLRLMFGPLSGKMPILEQLACGFGLGMMAVAALTLGIKLCGFSGHRFVFLLTASGAMAELWRGRSAYAVGWRTGFWNIILNLDKLAFFVVGLAVFLVLFRLAGVQGLLDPDAMRWMLKAKIIHLYTGNELVRWFSNRALAYAHLDFPTLVPSLHSATYDSIGHVDEFVTKFWPVWMLLFLLAALVSLCRDGRRWFYAPYFALLGLLLLPVIQLYVQMEGSTLPMIFFTVLGFVQCAIGMIGKDRARLGLGLTLLFGAAMTTFQGIIILALVLGWVFLLPSVRPSLKLSQFPWRVSGFWLLSALPFVCLRVRIPSLNYESGWVGYAVHHPGLTLLIWPKIFMIQLARLFMGAGFADWSRSDGPVVWIGKWDGLSSLVEPSTLGLPWLCLLMTVALWFAVPRRRQAVVWIFAVFLAFTAALTALFAGFAGIVGPSEAVAYTLTGGRYFLPMLLAWFVTLVIICFAELNASDQESECA